MQPREAGGENGKGRSLSDKLRALSLPIGGRSERASDSVVVRESASSSDHNPGNRGVHTRGIAAIIARVRGAMGTPERQSAPLAGTTPASDQERGRSTVSSSLPGAGNDGRQSDQSAPGRSGHTDVAASGAEVPSRALARRVSERAEVFEVATDGSVVRRSPREMAGTGPEFVREKLPASVEDALSSDKALTPHILYSSFTTDDQLAGIWMAWSLRAQAAAYISKNEAGYDVFQQEQRAYRTVREVASRRLGGEWFERACAITAAGTPTVEELYAVSIQGNNLLKAKYSIFGTGIAQGADQAQTMSREAIVAFANANFAPTQYPYGNRMGPYIERQWAKFMAEVTLWDRLGKDYSLTAPLPVQIANDVRFAAVFHLPLSAGKATVLGYDDRSDYISERYADAFLRATRTLRAHRPDLYRQSQDRRTVRVLYDPRAVQPTHYPAMHDPGRPLITWTPSRRESALPSHRESLGQRNRPRLE